MGRQAMTGMDDVERQAIHGDPEIMQQKKKAKTDCFVRCLLGICVALVLFMVMAVVVHRDVHYYVAIDSVSGLDPARGLSFNLTLGVSSWSLVKACIKPGTYVEVSYGGAKLAASDAETGRLCARPLKSAEQRVTANAVTGGMPLERLTADMKQGAAVFDFDVALHLPKGAYGMLGNYNGKKIVSWCGGRRLGDATAFCDAPPQI